MVGSPQTPGGAPEGERTRPARAAMAAPHPLESGSGEHDVTEARPRTRPAALGDVIAEKYRITRALGQGGMGRIFAAEHLLLGTTVALKLLHPHLARDRAQVARFAREARAAATLKSVHAARIIDVDQLPSGELYMVMEYLEGASLETMVVGGRALPIADAVLYVVQACDALAEAHARSIIHRDVKPANLFLTTGRYGEPIIKVLDFGLAKSMVSTEGFSSSSLSIVGEALGTPHYMAPEQVTGRPIDARSDVWAIGATLYELLTGHQAFGGATAPIVFDKILKGGPKPLATHRPEIAAALVAIVDRCLLHDPAARFQTVGELARALEASLRPTVAPSFGAAPLTTERFVRSAAPPTLPAPAPSASLSFQEGLSLRPAALSIPPSVAAPSATAPGPSIRQTVVAALVGPALLVLAAGVVGVVMGTSVGARVRSAQSANARAGASEVVYLTARSGDATRSKAPTEPRKPEPHRK